MIVQFRQYIPKTGEHSWVASNASVIGQVELGKHCSVWFQAVVRGDVQPIFIGDNSNVQDGTIIHGSTGAIPVVIGEGVTIGHGCIIHGCTLKDNVLIGMGSVVMDEAVVHSNVLLAARSVVRKRQILEPGYLYGGNPAKKIRPCSEQDLSYISTAAQHYVDILPDYQQNT